MADATSLIITNSYTIGVSFTATLFALDAATDANEVIFQAREAITITRVGFRYGARTGTPPTYTISLQGVDGSGNPDGVIKGGGSPASVAFTPPADATIDGLWQWKTLDNPYICTRGEFLALVIARSAGVIDGGNNSSFTITDGLTVHAAGDGLPYSIQNNGGVRTRQAARASFGYGSATKVYGHPTQSAFLNNTLTQASTPDELATRFLIPTRLCQSYQIQGVNIRILLGAAKTMKMQLYSGTTVLASVTLDTDVCEAAASNKVLRLLFQDANLPVLLSGAVYRIGFQPQDAAGVYNFSGVTQASNAEWGAYPLGTEWYISSRTDEGAWSDDNASRLACELILKDITSAPPQIINS
jgi:hypothetical protein